MEKIGRNEPCWCGSGRKYKQCHEAFDEKIKHFELQGHMVPERCMIKNPEQLAGIRESGLVNLSLIHIWHLSGMRQALPDHIPRH